MLNCIKTEPTRLERRQQYKVQYSIYCSVCISFFWKLLFPQKPERHPCICSYHNRLSFCTEILNVFGTVWMESNTGCNFTYNDSNEESEYVICLRKFTENLKHPAICWSRRMDKKETVIMLPRALNSKIYSFCTQKERVQAI